MSCVTFKINGKVYSVGCEVTSDITLLDYIRRFLELFGTKYMCREAGCGACIVAVIRSPGEPPVPVNSCLVPILSCQDWDVTTIEKVGNKKDGYHSLQTTLAECSGTQCGHCSPGWVMSMYSFLKSKKDPTMAEIENAFGSNICRCTGYRPILDAFKKYAVDAPKPSKITDIEDMYICKKNLQTCARSDCESDWCMVSENGVEDMIEIKLADGKIWYSVRTLKDLLQVLAKATQSTYMLISGNTAKAVYPIDEYPKFIIHVAGVSELKGYMMDQNLKIGAGNTISDLLTIYENVYKEEYFEYLQKIYKHTNLVAHRAVRNMGSIAGNLMIKHKHNEFPSDIFLTFETIGAELTIVDRMGRNYTITMQKFLEVDMTGKVILNVLLPPLSNKYMLHTFKIMPRCQSALAIVNAGFLFKLNKSTNTALEARIVYDGLSPFFFRATQTEQYLIGKSIFTNEVLQSAIKILERELVVDELPPKPSALFRKQLAVNLFYKALLSLCPAVLLNSRFLSGAINIHETRGVSSASQTYETKRSIWPINKPVPKVEGLIQCSGEAAYTEDLPSYRNEVFCAFVLSSVPTGDIVSIDPSKALNLPGVIAFYTAKDIPGVNSFTPDDKILYVAHEELLCSKSIKYNGQPIGIIVATSETVANRAAKLVHVEYNNVKTPVLDIDEARKYSNRISLFASADASETGTDVTKVIKGKYKIHGQMHITLETLVCVVKPTEEGLEVHAATQWLDGMHTTISRALNIEQSRIDIHTRRIGGGYGLKISRSISVAVACSLVAHILNLSCRCILTLPTVAKVFGKRLPATLDYEVGVNDSGLIQYVKYDLLEDQGYMINEQFFALVLGSINNCYSKARWSYKLYNVLTDTAKNTWCRAPGTLETIAFAEFLMDHISSVVKVNPITVRINNLHASYSAPITEILETLKSKANYTERRAAVTQYNALNRWKKRGLRFVFLRWTPVGLGYQNVTVSIYHGDGTVVITHGGIEMGQGVNTKAVQACSYILNIPMNKIQVKENNTIITPNTFISGGSLTSQNVCIGVQRCCNDLITKLKPIRDAMTDPTWEKVVAQAYILSIDLQSHCLVDVSDFQTYDVFGVTLTEVEIDALTGEMEICRVDLCEDAGLSYSPEVDIGQVEGAFTMGLGYWTNEKLVYDPSNGELLTDHLGKYPVPLAKDIPQITNVTLRENSYSTDTVYGSKCVGEPPICMSVGVVLALQEAICEAKLDASTGNNTCESFKIDGPFTLEHIGLSVGTCSTEFKFY